jgi:hypothetical protein
MARAGSSSSKSKPLSKPAPQPKYYAEVDLVFGAGEKKICFDNQKTLDRFIIDVTKRNLTAHPLRFVDAANKCFIIRGFLFCEITING